MFKELEKYGVYDDTGVEVTEVKIQTPTGIIAGKWWGSKSIKPILCLHGWQDNAGSFDRIIPLLPRNNSYLAIDFPGHGHSFWMPDGTMYHTLDLSNVITYLMNEYKWETVDIIGHSLGGGVGMMYAALFPEKVSMLICIESYKPRERKPEAIIKSLRESFDKFITTDQRNREKSEPPSYTIDEMIEKFLDSPAGSLTTESVPYILTRSISPSRKFPGKFFFSRDNRLKQNIGIMAENFIQQTAKDIKSPFQAVNAKNSFFQIRKKEMDEIQSMFENNPIFEYHDLDSSSHHVHLTEPEKTAKVIGKFILKHKKIQSHL